MKNINSIISLIIVAIILLTSIMPVLSIEKTPETIYISKAEDLYELSRKASLDLWSKGRTVILNNDIDLQGRDFTPIPIFSGTFEGGGYTIKGLNIKVEGSNQGLFRYLQEDGKIKNLKVEGTIIPQGDKNYIGGIVGHNNGIIENCSFSGFIKGKDTVGGIAGFNGDTGRIINSSSKGVLQGQSKVGGIAGYNTGVILNSNNEASVNTTVEEEKLDLQGLTIEDINLYRIFVDASDIGGIVGVNVGVVQSSENHGIVGYPHVGYNIGGIVGRQSGYVSKSINYGNVYGRKEVGGIVGQMEPYISMELPPSKLNQLHKELNNLQNMITKLINNSKVSSDILNNNLSIIHKDIDDSKGYIESLVNQTEAMINKDIEEINRISLLALDIAEKTIPIVESANHAMESMEKALNPMKKAMGYLSSGMGELSEFSGQYKRLNRILDDSIYILTDSIKDVEKGIEDLRKALELFYKGENEEGIKWLKSFWSHFEAAGKKIEKATGGLKLAGDEIGSMIGSLGYLGEDMSRALDYLVDTIEILEDEKNSIYAISNEIIGLLEYISEIPELEFETTDGQYQINKDGFFISMDSLTNSLFAVIDTVNNQSQILMDDIQQLSDQLFLIINLVFNMVEEMREEEIRVEDIIEDISKEDLDGKTEGKLFYNKNFGNIEGDINVGGIAGAMAMEFFLDPEDDFNIKGKPNISTIFKTRAIIDNCESYGDVVGKKNNIGGLVGNMDLGYIRKSLVTGHVESIEGNYVGGIAGKSYGAIDSSYVKASLSGGNYIGGISGLGKEISNSYTMINIDRHKTYIGAIAGNKENDSIIENNYFVSDILAGIDGISYGNKAEPISYDSLLNIEDLPEYFKGLKVRFWADNKLISTQDINYGDSISLKDIPEIPEKEGYYSRWEDFNREEVKFDLKVNAEYFPYISVLESKEKRDGVLSIVLVEGKFIAEDRLVLNEIKVSNEDRIEEGKLIEEWKIIIPEDENTSHRIRYIPPKMKKNLSIYRKEKDSWIEEDLVIDGKYLVFQTDEKEVTFILVDKGIAINYYLILLPIGILIITSFLIIKKRRKSRAVAS